MASSQKDSVTRSDWAQQPVTILGLSRSGIAAARYLSRHGANCFISETVPATSTNLAIRQELEGLGIEIEMGGHTAKCFSHADTVILSPGIPPTASIIKQLSMSEKTLMSEVELAFRECVSESSQPEADVPWIGITGTNGKTTVVSLISAILTHAGHKAPACGNIGIPVIDVIEPRPDYLVVELSSFQLTFSDTLKPKIAVMTNFRPDHLDWHGSQTAYEQAKLKLFSAPSPQWAILNAADPVCRSWEEKIDSDILWFSADPSVFESFKPACYLTCRDGGQVVLFAEGQPEQALLSIAQSPMVGQHNKDNMLSAVAVVHLLGISMPTAQQAIEAFSGVEHRLERVAQWQDITVYNDSKATNPDASQSALMAFEPGSIVLIAGGRDKGTTLDDWVDTVVEYAASVVLVGDAEPRFRQALSEVGYDAIHTADSMETAVQSAMDLAGQYAKDKQRKISVLFSPACSSFDQYKNFEARGQAFKAIVTQCLLSLSQESDSATSPSMVSSP